jgi:hypothetical protein
MALVVPSPKFQDQAVGVFEELSVKDTTCPMVGALGRKVKVATGAATATLTVTP